MKRNKSTKKELTKFIIAVLCIAGFFLLKGVSRNETKHIFNNADFSIGKLIEYSKGSGTVITPNNVVNEPGNPPFVKFKYAVKNIEYMNRYDANTYNIPGNIIVEGKEYLVVYYNKNPQKSRMLFDYPIKDSIDFERSVKEFEKTRKYRLGGGGIKSQQMNSKALNFHIRIDSTFLASYTVDSLPQVKDVKPVIYGGRESVYELVKKVAEYYEYRKFIVNDKVIGRILLVNIPMNLDGELKLVVLASYDKSGNPIDAIRLGKLEQVSDVYYSETASVANNKVVKNIHFDGYDAEAGDFVTRDTSEKYTIQENGIIKKE